MSARESAADAARAVPPPVARLHEISLRYGKAKALTGVSLEVPAGCMVGFIGPDGVGKSMAN